MFFQRDLSEVKLLAELLISNQAASRSWLKQRLCLIKYAISMHIWCFRFSIFSDWTTALIARADRKIKTVRTAEQKIYTTWGIRRCSYPIFQSVEKRSSNCIHLSRDKVLSFSAKIEKLRQCPKRNGKKQDAKLCAVRVILAMTEVK